MDDGFLVTAAAAASPGGLFDGIDLRSSWEAIGRLARNPTSNPAAALLLVSCVTLVVLMLLVFVLLWATPKKKRVVKIRRYVTRPAHAAPEEGGLAAQAPPRVQVAPPAPKKPPGPFLMAVTGPVAIAVLVAVGIIGSYVGTGSDAYCARTCHSGSERVRQAEKSKHASCTACHERGGLLGVLPNAASRVRMIVDMAVRSDPSAASVASDATRCLACHGDIAKKTVTSGSGAKVSHVEILEAAVPCAECHKDTGHVKGAFTSTMSACVVCHDGKTVSADCASCHSKDPALPMVTSKDETLTLGSGRIPYPAVRAANRDCGGCHDLGKQCDGCHRIRMPHSEDFKSFAHARAAAFGRKKTVCWRCHDPSFCTTPCHSGFQVKDGVSTHGPAFLADHKTQPWDGRGCGCHQGRRTPRTGPICTLCHAKNGSLLPILP